MMWKIYIAFSLISLASNVLALGRSIDKHSHFDAAVTGAVILIVILFGAWGVWLCLG